MANLNLFHDSIDDLVQDCNDSIANSIANALELL